MLVKIIEVGPRDGLQNESEQLSLKFRVELIKKLYCAGLRHIEVGSFVSAKWVPQMARSEQVVNNLAKSLDKKDFQKLSVLVPNAQGMQDALRTPIKEVAIFGACSESFSQKNINCSINEGFKRFKFVIREATKNKIKVRGYLSTAFGCPYEGRVSLSKTVSLTKKMLQLGVYEVSIGDTIGVATPKQVEKLILSLKTKQVDLKKVAMHFHDTRGTALANVLQSYQMGIRSFDSSIAGLGGCPYAPGASGNLATEDLVYMLHGMGAKTKVNLSQLIKIKPWIEKKLGKTLPAKVSIKNTP